MYVVSAFRRTSREVRLKPDTTYYMEPKTALATQNLPSRLQTVDVIRCGFDRHHDGDREQQPPHAPHPSPEEHRHEHGHCVQLAGAAGEPRRYEVALEHGDR